MNVVLLVLRRYSCHEAARVYEDSPRSVQHWVHRLTSRGLTALREADRPGRPPRLSESEPVT
ncbi:MAG: helix-turn-helix domain-containing protein [Bacillota bacterium]